VLTAIDYQMQLCRKEMFFETEQEELKHRIQSYTGMHMSKKNRKLHELEEQKMQAHNELQQTESKLNNLNKEKSDKLNNLKQEWNKLLQNLNNEKSAQADNIRKEDKEEQQRIASVKAEYENDMQKELHTQGADTERLQNIAEQLQNIELEKLERQYQQDMLDLENWKKKAEAERNRKLHELEEQKMQAHNELQQTESKLNNLNKEKSDKLNNLKQEWNKLLQNLNNEKSAQADNIRKEDKEEQQRIASVKAEYENDMQKELHTQGADTERLQNIAEQLQNIEQELLFIKDHAALIIEYQKDKRDLIDQIPTWQREYDEQKRLLNNEKESLHYKQDFYIHFRYHSSPNIFVVFHNLIFFADLFLCRREAHVFAGMVISENADTHAFVCGNFSEFRNVYIFLVFHFYRMFMCTVVAFVYYFYRNFSIYQFLYDIVTQASSLCSPEFNADVQTPEIAVACLFRKCG
jgi:6,7-dimethyl-8-ribityllumazine synthase